MFETSGYYDETFIQSTKYYFFSMKKKILVSVACTLWLAWMISAKINSNMSLFFICFVGIFAMEGVYFYSVNQTAKIKIKQMMEVANGQTVKMVTKFEEGAINVSTEGTDKSLTIPYDQLVKVEKAKKYYFIYTRALHVIVVYLEQLTDQEKEEVLSFLKRKAPQIKIDRYDKTKMLNYLLKVVLIVTAIVALVSGCMTYFEKNTGEPFTMKMHELTDREVREICTEVTQDNITAGVFDTLRSDEKTKDSYQLLVNRTVIHHMGYIIEENGKIVEADYAEIGSILDVNKYYILPIASEKKSFVTVSLWSRKINNISYAGENVEYATVKIKSSNPVVWCSFLVNDENVDIDKIKIE